LFIGLGAVTFFISGGYYFKDYFDLIDPEIRNKHGFDLVHLDGQKRIYLLSGLLALTGGVIFSYLLFYFQSIPISALIFLAIIFCFLFIFGIPPLRLGARGYGEFLLCITLADMIPAFAFLIQADVLHKLIPLITFPLTVLYLAMIISTSLKGYFADMLSGRHSMIIVIGWKFGMDLHNWLIALGFILVAINSLLGLPWGLTWTMLLPVPVFVFTVYEIQRIKTGAKPRWNLLSLSSYAGIGIIIYLTLFTLWFR
jgi:1,4-dihydroxy-2-naphthoate octaprenyltransferase